MEMIVFMGIQAAGKTTFYLQRFFDTHVRVSMDLLRTRYREQVFLQACLTTQQRCVIDNTNPSRSERSGYIAAAKNARFRVVGYFFEPDPERSSVRNQARAEARRVPPAGLYGTLKRLERPSLDEGFDELYAVKACDGKFQVAPLPNDSEGG